MIGLYEDHAEHRDQFEVLAVHTRDVESFADLDRKLTRIKERFWQGKNLPFPVLLDSTGETTKRFGIRAYPTSLLIDPDGKLVGEVSPADLEAKLPPLSSGKKWARHRGMQKNIFWSFEPSRDTLRKFADMLKWQTGCAVGLDADAIQASGLTPDGPLPGVLMGVNVTLRSIDELLLAPHGLGVAPSADGQKLLITRRSATVEPKSYLQRLHTRELTDQLDRRPAATAQAEAKPLAIKEEALLDAVKLVVREFDLPIALDAKAMRAGTLDPKAKVSGTISPGDLRISLTRMLEPLGLKVEVDHEVVLVTPKDK